MIFSSWLSIAIMNDIEQCFIHGSLQSDLIKFPSPPHSLFNSQITMEKERSEFKRRVQLYPNSEILNKN